MFAAAGLIVENALANLRLNPRIWIDTAHGALKERLRSEGLVRALSLQIKQGLLLVRQPSRILAEAQIVMHSSELLRRLVLSNRPLLARLLIIVGVAHGLGYIALSHTSVEGESGGDGDGADGGAGRGPRGIGDR